MPTLKRVPSLSGKVKVKLSNHSIWEGVREPIFHIWWPSQFSINNDDLKTLASFEYALDESFSADFNIGNVRNYFNWERLEELYGINLNPEKFAGTPLVVEGCFGKGKVILSLIHFDTPGDVNGHKVMKNLLNYLGMEGLKFDITNKQKCMVDDSKTYPYITDLQNSLENLIDFGIKNFLWFWRNEMILGWRRGIRGFECCNMYIMVKEMCSIFHKLPDSKKDDFVDAFKEIRDALLPFVESCKKLLFLERVELQSSHLTSLMTKNPDIERMRLHLYSKSKSYGGEYKKIIMYIDNLLLKLLRESCCPK
ncbi:MAG: hypothetical protein N2738_01060 [Thermodesulfovibrionales bacterium]|nr:hypothetical protein [Thermodesulfovibrionales bacterium]